MSGRGNGLEASSYAPLADLEPQVADAMLEALRDEGVAAYVVPATGHSAGLTMKEFRGPLDRLWVDAAAKARAQSVLDVHLPGLREDLERHAILADSPLGGESAAEGLHPAPATRDEEDAWAAIVASYHESPADPVPRWPVLEDVDEGDDEQAASRRGPARRRGDPGDAVAAAGDAADDPPEADGEENHFVPPPPPPLPRTDTVTKAAWVALLGGPLYLVVSALVGMEVGGWAAFLAAASFVGGFVTLVARMGDRPPTDSGPDDGAVV